MVRRTRRRINHATHPDSPIYRVALGAAVLGALLLARCGDSLKAPRSPPANEVPPMTAEAQAPEIRMPDVRPGEGRITGRVVNQEGEPIPWAQVSLRNPRRARFEEFVQQHGGVKLTASYQEEPESSEAADTPPSPRDNPTYRTIPHFAPETTALSDANGWFVIQGLLKDEGPDLVVVHEAYERAQTRIDGHLRGIKKAGTIVLTHRAPEEVERAQHARQGVIRGRILLPDDTTLPFGLHVNAKRVASPDLVITNTYQCHSDGLFEIIGLDPGHYHVYVSGAGKEDEIIVELEHPTDRIEVTLPLPQEY